MIAAQIFQAETLGTLGALIVVAAIENLTPRIRTEAAMCHKRVVRYIFHGHRIRSISIKE